MIIVKNVLAPALALVAVGVLVVPAQATFAAARTSAQLSAGAQPLASRPASLRLEPLGDSITYGLQSSTGNGYRGPLYSKLTAEGHPVDFVGSVRAGHHG